MSAIPAELLGLKVEVVRSSRRGAALHILGTALQVRVPLHLADERVAALLQQKRPWLTSKVAELQRLPPRRPRELISGESFPYLGRHYRLKVQEGQRVGVGLKGGTFIATVRPGEQGEQRQARIAHYLQQWYRRQALVHLSDKAARYSKQIGVSPAAISVRAFRARWGSCTTNGHVAFNWQIIKSPHSITDYVVIHELCHLIHPNHSKAFWQLVARHDPAYGQHRQWLRERGASLL
jgi:predicted metal-dependent hydrolase